MSPNKNTVLKFNSEFLERGNADSLKDLVDENFINHTVAASVPNNAEGLKLFVAAFHKSFSDVKVEIHEQTEENDVVATRKTIHVTHSGEFMGKPATGKRLAFNVMDFVRLKNGRYLEHWGQNNIMQVIQQL